MRPCDVLAWSVVGVVLIIVTSDGFNAMSYELWYTVFNLTK